MPKRLLPSLLLLVSLTPAALAQEPPPSVCPEVEVTSPDLATAGDSIEITAAVTGGDENVTPTYNWSVSDGAIESGQGTSTITVATAEVVSGFITATVEIGGYDRECATTDSATTSIEAKADDEEPAEEEPPPPPKPPR